MREVMDGMNHAYHALKLIRSGLFKQIWNMKNNRITSRSSLSSIKKWTKCGQYVNRNWVGKILHCDPFQLAVETFPIDENHFIFSVVNYLLLTAVFDVPFHQST